MVIVNILICILPWSHSSGRPRRDDPPLQGQAATRTVSDQSVTFVKIFIRMNVRIYLYQQNYRNEYPKYFGKINLGKLNFGQIHFVVKGSAGTSPTTLTTGSHESDKNGIIFAVVTLHVHQMHLQSTCPILNYGCKVTQLLFAWYFCNVCLQMWSQMDWLRRCKATLVAFV